MSSNYDSDDAFPRSPGLTAIKFKATPSPSPPPEVTPHVIVLPAETVSSSSSRRRKRSNRQKPSQGDAVLIRAMDPNQPEIAQLAGQRALSPTTSDSGGDDDDESMDGPSPTADHPPAGPMQSQPPRPADSSVNFQEIAREVLKISVNPAASHVTKLPMQHRDSVVEPDSQSRGAPDADSSASQASPAGFLNGIHPGANGMDANPSAGNIAKVDTALPALVKERHGSIVNGKPSEDSLATSPNLRELAIPQSRCLPSQKLPALQTPRSPSRDGPAGSPNQERRLPSFKHLSELAETAINEQHETNGSNGFHHRQSISSIAQSPISGTRQLSISSARSPGTAFPPLSAASPSSASSEIQTRDPFLSTGQHFTLFSTRRPSQASENGPYAAAIHSTSTTTNESYHSSDGLSPGTQPPPMEVRTHRMSIDNAIATRTLPPPISQNTQHIPHQGAGGFKCDFPGCNAVPFQTQYLLNSHANVHSQSRPHYCPVAGCPRGEGGKGFKRKNEMIRHGLVHASPGYVCPFCPDREHKYPRPDNLQRHVRVHHVDKNREDPQLREVLAQRPEGGSRGRRRRVSS